MSVEIDKRNVAHIRNCNTIQTVDEHSYNVSKLSEKYAEPIKLKNVSKLIGLLHDYGKYSKKFTSYILSAAGILTSEDDDYIDYKSLKGQIDHSTAGSQFLMTQWNVEDRYMMLKVMVSTVVMSHHTGLIDISTPGEKKGTFEKRLEKKYDETHLDEALINMSANHRERVENLFSSEVLENEFNALVERIRNKSIGKRDALFKMGMVTKYLLSCLVDADRTDTFNFMNEAVNSASDIVDWGELSGRIAEHLEQFNDDDKISIIRRKISDECYVAADKKKGIYVLSAPTGTGKTLSSLRFALKHAKKYNMSRIIYIAPFISILDQNADAIRKAITKNEGPNPKILEHHSSIVIEQTMENEFKMMTDNWDVQIVITTMVQYLNTFYINSPGNIRRLHNLSNSILIFDETQAVPLNCVGLFNESVNFLFEFCESSIILCTATPPGNENRVNKHTIISSEELINPTLFDDVPRRTEYVNLYKENGWRHEEIIEKILIEFDSVSSLLIVLNTKKEAETISKMIERTSEHQVYYLSTNLCPMHRKTVITKIKKELNDGCKIICVSTQLIEAGVDLDFDVVFRSITGWPSIEQSAGRCNRNGKKKIGKVFLYNSSTENVDHNDILRKGRDSSLRIIRDNDYVKSSKDVLGLYNMYFENRFKPNDFEYKVNELGTTIYELLSNGAVNVNYPLKQSFDAATKHFHVIDQETQGVVVEKLMNEEMKDKLRLMDKNSILPVELVRNLQQYSVNIRQNRLKKMIDSKIVKEIMPESGIYNYIGIYDDKYGIMEEEN